MQSVELERVKANQRALISKTTLNVVINYRFLLFPSTSVSSQTPTATRAHYIQNFWLHFTGDVPAMRKMRWSIQIRSASEIDVDRPLNPDAIHRQLGLVVSRCHYAILHARSYRRTPWTCLLAMFCVWKIRKHSIRIIPLLPNLLFSILPNLVSNSNGCLFGHLQAEMGP